MWAVGAVLGQYGDVTTIIPRTVWRCGSKGTSHPYITSPDFLLATRGRQWTRQYCLTGVLLSCRSFLWKWPWNIVTSWLTNTKQWSKTALQTKVCRNNTTSLSSWFVKDTSKCDSSNVPHNRGLHGWCKLERRNLHISIDAAVFMRCKFLPVLKLRQFEYSTEAPKQKTPHFALQDVDTTSNLAALIRHREEREAVWVCVCVHVHVYLKGEPKKDYRSAEAESGVWVID